MNHYEALMFAASCLEETGESGTGQAALLLRQLAEDYPIATPPLPDDRMRQDE